VPDLVTTSETRAAMRQHPLRCPSAQPEMEGAQVLGVVEGSIDEPLVSYLNETVPVSPELLAMSGPVKPTEVFRFAAHCEEHACRHFDGSRCRLATRIIQILPPATEAVPACLIRPSCRWYRQEGRAACLRCPQIVTENCQPTEHMARAAGY
jgi:hypothetical protein